MSRANRREVLSHQARVAADRWVAAEVRFAELAAFASRTGHPVDARRARKAHRRAIAAGDHLADDLPDLVAAGLKPLASDLVGNACVRLGRGRKALAHLWAGAEAPAAHPLAWPGRRGWPRSASVA